MSDETVVPVSVLESGRVGNEDRKPTETISGLAIYEGSLSTIQLGQGYYAVLDQFGAPDPDVIAVLREQVQNTPSPPTPLPH